MSKGQSWGRYPAAAQRLEPCHWQDQVVAILQKITRSQATSLAFGNGRSYGDSCMGTGQRMLSMRRLDRFIELDRDKGTLTAEAGVTLGEILQVSVPAGWFLSVTPGTQYATLGGSIANDVHGKNHHACGTFGNHLCEFGLLRHGELIRCSPSENTELFNATIGGLGLTGIILWAKIRLLPIHTSQIVGKVKRFNQLDEFFSMSAELDAQHKYSVAWIDCVAKNNKLGRGVYMVGDHAEYGTLQVPSPNKLSIPLIPPISLVNRLSLKAFNLAYWHKHPAQMQETHTSYLPFFYPLDGIHNWNRIYGRKGFQQYQCVIPEACASDALKEILTSISTSGQGSFLAVLKRCGDIASPGLLSFPLPGTTLALDFPQSAKLGRGLFQRLDTIVHQSGGRLYPAKDAHMSATHFKAAYPTWERLEALRDPALNSLFWQRVTR